MARTRILAISILVATLALGVVVGAIVGPLVGSAQRHGAIPPAGGPPQGGFPEIVHDMLVPRDDAQWAQMRPLVDSIDNRNRATVDSAREKMSQHLDDMARGLDSLLTPDQRDRLHEFVERMRAGPGGRGGPIPGLPGGGDMRGGRGGPPPDGRRGGPPPPGR